jgi:hypothetical protein
MNPRHGYIALMLGLVILACGEDRSHLTEGQDLGIHCSATSADVRQRLGEPTKLIEGLGGYDEGVRQEGEDMGLADMVYKDLGVSFGLRHDRVYRITITKKYNGTFWGFPMGAHISDIIDQLGLPYGDTATPERAIQIDLTREDWLTSGEGDRWAYYLIDESPTHHLSFMLDSRGLIRAMNEVNNDIRGAWFVMPQH